MNMPAVCEEAAAAAAMAALRSNTLPFTAAGGLGGPVPALASSRVARVEQSTWSVFAVCEKESEVRSENDSDRRRRRFSKSYRRDEGGLGALEAPRERHPGLHDLIREGGGVSVVEDLRRPPQHRHDVPENPSCHPACRARAAPPLLQPEDEHRGLRHLHRRRHRLRRCHLFPFLSSRSRAFCRGWPSHPSPMMGNAFRLPPHVVGHARPAGRPEIFRNVSDWIRLAWKGASCRGPEGSWVVDGEDGD